MRKLEWSASLICADLFRLEEEVRTLQEFKVSYLHVDVMDGLFVPRIGMYPEMIQAIRKISSTRVEVHLMVQNPEPYLRVFAEAGASIVTIHLEACGHNLLKTMEAARHLGMEVGIALNPETEFTGLDYVNEWVDYILLMGINPGVLGQKLKPFMIDKIAKYRAYSDNLKKPFKIIIDGGVNFQNAGLLHSAGADILVGGSQTIFHASSSVSENLRTLLKMERGGIT